MAATTKWGDLGDWDVSGVKDFSYAFSVQRNKAGGSWADTGNVKAAHFTFSAISKWTTTSLTKMQGTFDKARAMNADLTKWSVNKVITMKNTFNNANAFVGTGLDRWDTPSLANMEGMFSTATSMNAKLGDWQVSSVTSLKNTFAGAWRYDGDELKRWDVSEVTNFDNVFDLTSVSSCAKLAVVTTWETDVNGPFDVHEERMCKVRGGTMKDVNGSKSCVSPLCVTICPPGEEYHVTGSEVHTTCTQDNDCDFQGCDQRVKGGETRGWCPPQQRVCYTGSTDSRCEGLADGAAPFGSDDAGWCFGGRRDVKCFKPYPDSSCVACPSGTYSNADDANPCVNWSSIRTCPPGEELVSGSTSTDTRCEKCSNGKFSQARDAQLCAAWSVITSCPPGHGYVNGSAVVDASCPQCTSEKFSTEDNLHSCAPWSVESCKPGQGYHMGSSSTDSSCSPCKKVDAVPVLIGCRKQDGSIFINDLLKAMYATDATQTMCGPSGCSSCTLVEKNSSCTNGCYSAGTDKTGCVPHTTTPCKDNSPKIAGTPSTDAACAGACANGTFAHPGGDGTCVSHSKTKCVPGFGYVAGNGFTDSMCTACESGKYSKNDDSGACLPHSDLTCGVGQGFVAGVATADTSCVTCSVGTYSTTNDATGCKMCAAGYVWETVYSECTKFTSIPSFVPVPRPTGGGEDNQCTLLIIIGVAGVKYEALMYYH